MAEIVSNNPHRKAQKLAQRIQPFFGNVTKTRYWLLVSYYQPGNGYNIFFNIKRSKIFSRSIPVDQYENCSFEELLLILKAFRQYYHFTIDFSGFTKEQRKEIYQHKLIN